MVNAADVSAVLVTRGNVDMKPIIASMPFPEVIVWDNSKETDLGVYGRYAAISRASADVIYVQDDDVILPPDSITDLLSECELDRLLVANMPEGFRAHYSDSCLIGFGAVFHRDLPARSFQQFISAPVVALNTVDQPKFRRTCDVVFTTFASHVWVDVPYFEREFARDPDRMYQQPEHYGERQGMLELARRALDQVAA